MNTTDLVGQTLGGRYQIQSLIGQGGMASVYRAYDINLHRAVAIKVIHPHLSNNQEFFRRFEEEATAVAHLRHPNIVQVYDFSHDGNLYYMVMEFVMGETLQSRLKRINASRRRLRVDEVKPITSDICDAAFYAHQRGLIHRDIKPANIMLDVNGRAILMDFGIARIVGGTQHTATGAVLGTAMYMSPEQIQGIQIDARADIYSIGITLFEMLSGKPPFEADSAITLMMMHLNDPVPDLHELHPDIPPELIEITNKALAKNRDARYQSANEMANVLRKLPEQPQKTTMSFLQPSQPLPETSEETRIDVPDLKEKDETIIEALPSTPIKKPSVPIPSIAQAPSTQPQYPSTLVEQSDQPVQHPTTFEAETIQGKIPVELKRRRTWMPFLIALLILIFGAGGYFAYTKLFPGGVVNSPLPLATSEITSTSVSSKVATEYSATASSINSAVPSTTESIVPLASSTSEKPPPPTISEIFWEGDHTIRVNIKPWPNSWPFKIYVDGKQISQDEESGKAVVRPNAPLNKSPEGLIIGALPWVTGLDHVDFPCCGSVQISIPGIGLSNSYEFNLSDMGCKTASTKECPSEWTTHEGDWIISGSESVMIESQKIIQRGNIYVADSATLSIRDSELRMERGDTPTIHVYIFVDPKATLIIDHSRIYPGPINGGLACVMNHGVTKIINSPTQIHYFDMSDGASLVMENSEMVYEIGGLLQVAGGTTNISNSTLGALAVRVPGGAHLNASDLHSGTYFEHWKVQDLIPDADYELSLNNVTVLKDNFTGDLKHGPYERGWIFFLDRDSHVRLSNSELRKVFIDIIRDTAEFNNLKVGVPSSLEYRDIILKDITIEGQWPFTIIDSTVTISNSNYLFLQPSGSSIIKLTNSSISEFIPRQFSGTMIFENGEWTTAGEILGGVDYHSVSNNFTIKGSLKLGDKLRENLQWKNAEVTREFKLIIIDPQGVPIRNATIRVGGREYATDENGQSVFPFVFNEENYRQPNLLEVMQSGEKIYERTFDFFTETPVRINL